MLVLGIPTSVILKKRTAVVSVDGGRRSERTKARGGEVWAGGGVRVDQRGEGDERNGSDACVRLSVVGSVVERCVCCVFRAFERVREGKDEKRERESVR